MRNYSALLKARFQSGYFVCVGLDPDYAKLPDHLKTGTASENILHFCEEIITATQSYTAAYKLQSSFFEALGSDGIVTIAKVIQFIQKSAPNIPIILDAKRGDIGSSNAGYVKAIFDDLGADAVTVHPYLGQEALAPFLEYPNKGIIVLCHTSNPGAAEFQELTVNSSESKTGLPLYQYVAMQVANHWNRHKNCSLVVGATYPAQLQEVRSIVGAMPILVPGIGAQGGDLQATLKAGFIPPDGNILISSSRQIIFASSGKDFAKSAGQAAQQLHQQISNYRHDKNA